MLKFEKYSPKHIADVQELYSIYLLPKHLKRLGISKDEVTEEIVAFERLMSVEFLSLPFMRECSMVCTNEDGKVIAFQMNYFLDEDTFNEEFINSPKKILSSPNTPKNLRDYAQYVLDLYDGHDLFDDKCKRYLYFDSGVTLPEYRNHEIHSKLSELCVLNFMDGVDGILIETMIKKEKLKNFRVDDEYTLLRQIETLGYVCSLYALKKDPKSNIGWSKL